MDEGGRRARERCEDATMVLLTLTMEGEVTSQGMQVASISWKTQENGLCLRASRRTQLCQHPDFSPIGLILDF